MTTYPLGAIVELDTTVTNDSGAATDATVALTVVKPDLTTASPAVSHPSIGQYTASVTADQAGTYTYVWSASGAVTTSDAGQFDIGSPAPPSYAAVADLRIRLGLLDNTKDSILAGKLVTASRAIEDDCGRRFWLDPAPVQRTFSPRHRTFRAADGEHLLIDDIGSANGLIVETGSSYGGSSWSSVPYYATGPDNALVRREPITYLVRPSAGWSWSAFDQIRITARWGWPYIPSQITEACLIYAMRLYRRKDSPEGTTGSPELGQIRISNYDPDYVKLIDRFLIHGGG